MPKFCILYGCKSSTKLGGLRFHRIPWKDKNRAKIWVDFLVSKGTDRNRINANSRLCSRHFRQGEADPSVVSSHSDVSDCPWSDLQGGLGVDASFSMNGKREIIDDTDLCQLGDQHLNTTSEYGTRKDSMSMTCSVKEESGHSLVNAEPDQSCCLSSIDSSATDLASLLQDSCAGEDTAGLSESDSKDHSKIGEDLSDLPPEPAKKRRGKGRGPRPHWEWHYTAKNMAILSLKDSSSLDTKRMKTEHRRLAFYNPGGKVVEQFDADTSVREMRKKSRHFVSTSRTKAQFYDEAGCLLDSGQDLCDCLDPDCPGCHFPCKVCGSEKCGLECRCSRRWVYDSITVEGTELHFKGPLYRKHSK